MPLVLRFTGSKEVMLEVLMNVLEQLPENNYVQKTVLEAILGHVDTMSFSRSKLLSHQTTSNIPDVMLFRHTSNTRRPLKEVL